MSYNTDFAGANFINSVAPHKLEQFWVQSNTNKAIIIVSGLVLLYVIYWIIMKLIGKEEFRGLGSMKNFQSRATVLPAPSAVDADVQAAGVFDPVRGDPMNLGLVAPHQAGGFGQGFGGKLN